MKVEELTISKYWQNQGLTITNRTHGRTYDKSDGSKGCDECCNGDRCDDPTHRYRPNCPACLGTGYNLSCE